MDSSNERQQSEEGEFPARLPGARPRIRARRRNCVQHHQQYRVVAAKYQRALTFQQKRSSGAPGILYHPQTEALLQWFEMGTTSDAIGGAFSYPNTTALP
jgi:hypothetical protein